MKNHQWMVYWLVICSLITLAFAFGEENNGPEDDGKGKRRINPNQHLATDHQLVIRSTDGQVKMGTDSGDHYRAEVTNPGNEVKGVYSWLDPAGVPHVVAFNSGKSGYRTMPIAKAGLNLPPFPHSLYGNPVHRTPIMAGRNNVPVSLYPNFYNTLLQNQIEFPKDDEKEIVGIIELGDEEGDVSEELFDTENPDEIPESLDPPEQDEDGGKPEGGGGGGGSSDSVVVEGPGGGGSGGPAQAGGNEDLLGGIPLNEGTPVAASRPSATAVAGEKGTAHVSPVAQAFVGQGGVAIAFPTAQAASEFGGISISRPVAVASAGAGGVAVAGGTATATAGFSENGIRQGNLGTNNNPLQSLQNIVLPIIANYYIGGSPVPVANPFPNLEQAGNAGEVQDQNQPQFYTPPEQEETPKVTSYTEFNQNQNPKPYSALPTKQYLSYQPYPYLLMGAPQPQLYYQYQLPQPSQQGPNYVYTIYPGNFAVTKTESDKKAYSPRTFEEFKQGLSS